MTVVSFSWSRFMAYCILISLALWTVATAAGLPLSVRIVLAVIMVWLAMVASTDYKRGRNHG